LELQSRPGAGSGQSVARYDRNYTGERRTEFLGLQLTPTERTALETGAVQTGAATLSQFARDLLLSRLGEVVTAATRRNPENKALRNAINAAGNLLNQLMRHGNATGELGPERLEDVEDVLRQLRAAAHRLNNP
jgi:hypothetical protein